MSADVVPLFDQRAKLEAELLKMDEYFGELNKIHQKWREDSNAHMQAFVDKGMEYMKAGGSNSHLLYLISGMKLNLEIFGPNQ